MRAYFRGEHSGGHLVEILALVHGGVCTQKLSSAPNADSTVINPTVCCYLHGCEQANFQQARTAIFKSIALMVYTFRNI